jgi:hypothetical protein
MPSWTGILRNKTLRMDQLSVNVGKRVQLTCVAASSNLLALGANTGSVYIYKLEPFAFIKMISLNENVRTQDSVTQVCFK